MTRPIDDLNALPAEDAAEALGACCGAHRWVRAMVARRPFASIDDALSAADDAWAPLGPGDWREAFSHHPRIGEQHSEQAQGVRAAAWSAGEQGAVGSATDHARAELAQVNRDYEAKFGHIYIVCAAGKTVGELLAIARRRLQNESAAELRVAAREQHQITRLRLRKLLSEPP